MEHYGIKLIYKVDDSHIIPYIDRIIKAYEGLGSLSVIDDKVIEILTTPGNINDIKTIMTELQSRIDVKLFEQRTE